MSNIITETLEDGTDYEFDMDLCMDVAEDTLQNLYDLEGELPMYDFIATTYSLFISCSQILMNSGWTKEDLAVEIECHSDVEVSGTIH